VQDLETGGLERLVAETTLGMDHDRFSVEVCCFDSLGGFTEQLQANGIAVTLVQRDQTKYDKFYPFRLAKFFRQRQPDILQLHSGTFFPGAIAGWLARVPAKLYTDHGRALIESRFRLRTDYLAGMVIDKIIAVSAELEQYLLEVVKLPKKKTVTILNGVNTEHFCPGVASDKLKAELGLPLDARIVGTVGRLDSIKDQQSMIKAIELVRSQIPKAALVIVGTGPLADTLEKQVAEANLQGVVVLAGERSDITETLRLFEIFVLSSLSEGTSISLLEAMASGIAPVVTNVGGNPSVVTHDHDGLITEPGEPQQLADAIIRLLRDEPNRTRLARQAVKRVEDNFSLHSMIDNYTNTYLEMLKPNRKYRWLADG
jgi:glycosyltransferase involved in cell wall biosynthesis